jgi:hypothetical protein
MRVLGRILMLLGLLVLLTLLPLRLFAAPLYESLAGGVPVDTNTVFGRTLAARAGDRINVLDYGATGNGATDDGPAISAAIAQANAVFAASGNRMAVYFPAGRYRVATALTQFAINTPGALKGDGRFKTFILMDPALSGTLFSWSETWGLTPLYTGVYPAATAWNGAEVDDMTISGNTANGAVQNALVFYDRNDYVQMHNVDLMYFNGACLRVGQTLNEPQAYMRESNFYGIRMWGCGSSSVAALTLDSANTSPTLYADATNEVSFYNLDIVSSNGKSIQIANTATGAGGNGGTRLIRFFGARVESGTDDLITLGASGSAGLVNTVQFLGLEENAVAAGKCGVKTVGTSTASPTSVRIEGSVIGGSGQGACIGAGSDIRLAIEMATSQTNLTVGPSSAVLGPIYVDGNGREYLWTSSIDTTSAANVRLPSYNYGTPGGAVSVMAGVHDSTPARGYPIPPGSVDLQTTRFSQSQVASGGTSVVSGGENNTASNYDSVVAGGNQNTASGYRAAVGGGAANLAFGQYSAVPGGVGNTAAGTGAVAMGSNAADRAVNGKFAYASGDFAVQGDAEMGWVQLRGAPSATSAVRLTSDGAAPSAYNLDNLPVAGTLFHLRASATCRDTTNGDWAGWNVVDAWLNRPATGSLVYTGGYSSASAPSQSSGAGSTASLILAADQTYFGLSASVTMPNTHLWHCVLKAETPEEVQ